MKLKLTWLHEFLKREDLTHELISEVKDDIKHKKIFRLDGVHTH